MSSFQNLDGLNFSALDYVAAYFLIFYAIYVLIMACYYLCNSGIVSGWLLFGFVLYVHIVINGSIYCHIVLILLMQFSGAVVVQLEGHGLESNHSSLGLGQVAHSDCL